MGVGAEYASRNAQERHGETMINRVSSKRGERRNDDRMVHTAFCGGVKKIVNMVVLKMYLCGDVKGGVWMVNGD